MKEQGNEFLNPGNAGRVVEPDWKSFSNPFRNPPESGNSAISTFPSEAPSSRAIYPEDSILYDWMLLARKHCECSDFQILGAILPICGAIMARTVRMNFFGKKYPNIYSMIVAPPGHRKSTLIGLAEELARTVLQQTSFTDAMTSDEALFDQYDEERGGSPDQLLIVDEGNTLFTAWVETSYGKSCAKRYLSLYDCKAQSQSFRGNRQADNGSVRRTIPETSTSVLIGATHNVCRMQRLEVRDGMWRRFLKYPSERIERSITFSEAISGAKWNDLGMLFEQLKHVGEAPLQYHLCDEARELFREYKERNIAKLEAIPVDLSPVNEAKASVLSEELSHVLKIAMIFERCRWVKINGKVDQPLIRRSTLELAYEQVQQCIAASDSLENIAKRSEIRDIADSIRAQVLTNFIHWMVNGFIPLTRTDLTNRFAKNAGRRGAMNNNRLYHEVIPDLEKRNLVRVWNVKGTKKKYYLFQIDD